jgi:hypothetical protein
MKTEPPRILKGALFKTLSKDAGIGIHKIMKLIFNLNKQWPDALANKFRRLFQRLQ